MSAVSNGSSVYSSLGLTSSTPVNGSSTNSAAAAAAGTALNEQDFLQLMTAQVKAQDPLNPITNNEFFSQIAQFSTVSGINQLNSAFSTLSSQLSSSQSLQAANLIGHDVMVPGNQAQLTSNGMYGAVNVPASGDVTVQIKDSGGALVGTLDLGTQSAGNVPFSWNGKDSSGKALPAGTYTISAQVGSGSGAQAANTDVLAQVLSVSMNAGGALMLNLQGLGQIPFSQVQQIL